MRAKAPPQCFYCCREHQKHDWKAHKSTCGLTAVNTVGYLEAASMEARHTIERELALETAGSDGCGRQLSLFFDASVCDSYATFRTAVETAAKKGKVPVPSVICRMPNTGLGMMFDTKWLDLIESEGLLEGDRPQILLPEPPPWNVNEDGTRRADGEWNGGGGGAQNPSPRQVRTKHEDGTWKSKYPRGSDGWKHDQRTEEESWAANKAMLSGLGFVSSSDLEGDAGKDAKKAGKKPL